MKEIKNLQQNVENKQPSNLEAEQALIGSILINNDIIDEVSTIVNSSTFYDPAHVKIYEVIENLNNKGMIANPITLKNFFEKDNMLNDVGGTEYLVKLTRFSTVKWRESLTYMEKENVRNFIEIGPGKALTGMVKRTLKNVNCFSINTIADINNFKNEFKK